MRHLATIVLVLSAALASWGSPAACGQEALLDDPLAKNAALAYWQAFVLLPKLEGKLMAARDEALKGGPVDAELAKMVDAQDGAFDQFHRGAKMSECVWGLDVEAGVEMQLPHLSRAREMAKFACLRARIRWEQDRPSDAVDDVTATMAMARDCGRDGLVISLLVQYAIEEMAIQVASRQLTSLPADDLATLSRRLDALRESKTMGDAMRTEKALLLEWFIRQMSKPEGKQKIFELIQGSNDANIAAAVQKYSDEELIAGLVELRPIYDRFTRIMSSLSPDELDDTVMKLKTEFDLSPAGEGFADVLLPAIGSIRRAEVSHQTRLVMLKAAIAVVQDGKTALARNDLQHGSGPFSYTKLEGGFELRSSVVGRDGKPLTLVVGPAVAK